MFFYPNEKWEVFKFADKQPELWANIPVQKEFMEMAGNRLGVKQMSGWYNVNNEVRK